jgi:hypothetical protein
MTEYRDRTTGDIKTQGQLRKANPNMSLPKVWNANVLDALNVDPVYKTNPPTTDVGPYQMLKRSGIEQNASGDWVYKWVIVDRFFDDEHGTKAEKEAAYQKEIDEAKETDNRHRRDRKLAETDWWASSDLTMTAEQTAYRQALRDITSHANWPHLEAADWPTKPE